VGFEDDGNGVEDDVPDLNPDDFHEAQPTQWARAYSPGQVRAALGKSDVQYQARAAGDRNYEPTQWARAYSPGQFKKFEITRPRTVGGGAGGSGEGGGGFFGFSSWQYALYDFLNWLYSIPAFEEEDHLA